MKWVNEKDERTYSVQTYDHNTAVVSRMCEGDEEKVLDVHLECVEIKIYDNHMEIKGYERNRKWHEFYFIEKREEQE